ncbi:anti-sigma factor domain-containing protein [Lihuaxuella thermophila]|uniref:Anti-sigma factor N-terminus n=1 Tax=Lihuaxuella thermophila TaxID=1173111 RepID=A0A1H8C0V4_9BACL|nr:anti-sigma factor domain-containing protein [Lihuaxuella thermophila]SEM88811.1 Anti-sigma factor N-terminus [Lihuaxuella thermophila]
MQKGIIMEIRGRHWIVMTQDGEFVKIPKTNSAAQIGEEIRFQEGRATKRQPWMMVASVAAAAMLGMFFVFPQFFANQAHAETYVYLDLNPSIAIGLDKDQHVVQIKPLNSSAKKLVREIDWQDKKLDEVAVDLLDQAKSDGYLHRKDHVIISGIKEDKYSVKALKSLEKTIEKNAQSIENSLDLEVHTLVMPKQVQTKAEKTGLSPTKYAVWLLAKKEGQQIPVEELEEKSISELANIEPVTELLQKPLSEQEWSQIIQEDGSEVPSGKETAPGDNSGADKKEDATPGTAEPAEGTASPSNDGEKGPGQPADGKEPASTDQPPADGSHSSDPQNGSGTGDSSSESTTGTETGSSETTP